MLVRGGVGESKVRYGHGRVDEAMDGCIGPRTGT